MMETVMEMNIAGIASVVEGTPKGNLARPVRDVQVDSRSCNRDSLFVALTGDRTDGHLFLKDAFRRGSSLSFVSRQYWSKHQAEIESFFSAFDASVIIVEDTLVALQRYAAHHLRGLRSVVSIAVTGSNGKTTTKDLIGAMLAKQAPTAVSPGNLNSDIGLPLACFGVKAEHQYAVFEMGMNRPGEIAELVSIVKPRVATITNIGTAHIGMIGSREGIAAEKRDVFEYICEEGRGFIHEDDPYAAFLAEGRSDCVETFGLRSTPGIEEIRDLGIGGIEVVYRGRKVTCPLVGGHNIPNLLCAISVAQWIGVEDRFILDALREARTRFGRNQILEGRATILLDCYNANRQSVLRAIDTFDTISTTGRKILVLGSMLELGTYSVEEHTAVGERAAGSTADLIVFVGAESEPAYAEARKTAPGELRFFPERDEVLGEITSLVHDGDLVLIKGSRSLELEALVPLIDPALAGEFASC